MNVTRLHPTKRVASQFKGKSLAELFGFEAMQGGFDDDVWRLDGHPDAATATLNPSIIWDSVPTYLVDQLKELAILERAPHLHTQVSSALTGVKPFKIATILMHLHFAEAGLIWLVARAGTLAEVTQADLDALASDDDMRIDANGTNAIMMFGRYGVAMTPGLDRFTIAPWEGKTALAAAHGRSSRTYGEMANKTLPLTAADLSPWLLGAMFLVENGDSVVRAASAVLTTGKIDPETPDWMLDAPHRDPDPARTEAIMQMHLSGLNNPRIGEQLGISTSRVQQIVSAAKGPERSATLTPAAALSWINGLVSACAFVTVTFTGMRPTEYECIPRIHPLARIDTNGVQRWMLTSYLVKGMTRPKREQWLIPPIVAQAINVVSQCLTALNIQADTTFAPTGQAPLFDIRLIKSFRPRVTASPVIEFGQAVTSLGLCLQRLADDEHTMLRPGPRDYKVKENGSRVHGLVGKTPTARELRRTFARIVSGRAGGPQAAMEQFKWQKPETAGGYFRISPDTISLSQRQVYDDIRGLNREMVLDTAVNEYDLWNQRVEHGHEPDFPAGPDGFRKRDLFASVKQALAREPQVVEDHRRLRMLLSDGLENVYITAFGWCDYNADYALCEGWGGPNAMRCRPNECMNSSTLSITLAPHLAKHDRLVGMARDKTSPSLLRAKAKAAAVTIEQDLGPLLEASHDE